MESKPYVMNGADLNGHTTDGAVLNGAAPLNGHSQHAVVKQVPAAPASEPTVTIEPQNVTAPKEKKKRVRFRESGHGINLRNFGRIIDDATAQGDAYDESNPLLVIDALQDVYDACDLAISKVSNKKALLDVAVELQVSEYADLKRTCTMVYRYFQTCGVSAMAIAQLKNINAVIQGYRVIKPKDGDTELNSVSHQSYAQLAIYFDAFIQFLEQQPAYNPGNLLLKTAALRAKHTRMVEKYRAVEMMRTENQECAYSP